MRADILFNKGQHVFDGFIEDLHLERAVLHAVQDPLATDGGIARHFEIEPRLEAFHAVVHRAPIGHHEPVKAPFLAKNVGQQPFILAAIFPVYFVIGAHHRGGMALFHNYLKHFEINFADGALIGDGISHETEVFRIVEGKVLDGDPHALALYPLDFGCRHFSRKVRIFGKIFEVAPRQRVALDIRPGAQHNMDAVFMRLFSDRRAHLLGILGLPARSYRRRRGEGSCRFTRRNAVVAALYLHSEPVRPV